MVLYYLVLVRVKDYCMYSVLVVYMLRLHCVLFFSAVNMPKLCVEERHGGQFVKSLVIYHGGQFCIWECELLIKEKGET